MRPLAPAGHVTVPGFHCHAAHADLAPEPTISGPKRDLGMVVGTEGEDHNFREAEYAAIHSMLDQINSCLDHPEEKNDRLHACLQELLESNQLIRPEFQQHLRKAPS
ncbi:bublin coiled-coil protein-like [Hippopotamus amphibius kiboko]|uniref:bublin coiled-coil protein-like n=1 Tax=Hippopotamus amphibius kiboko TaxID=575201 RepID=UPI0025931EC4|nr:bublin coiled-coil protein-like [Hippopotamus amphibius kiboko]